MHLHFVWIVYWIVAAVGRQGSTTFPMGSDLALALDFINILSMSLLPRQQSCSDAEALDLPDRYSAVGKR